MSQPLYSYKSHSLLTAVDINWLDEVVRKLPLFIVMANGTRSFKTTHDNKEGHLIPNTYNEHSGTVQVFVRGVGRVDVHPRHLLPKHPHKTPAPNSVSLVTPLDGPGKGLVTRLVTVEGDVAWVTHWDEENVLAYQKNGLALTKVPVSGRA